MPDPNNNQSIVPPMVSPTVDIPPMPDLISTSQPVNQSTNSSDDSTTGSSAPPVSFPDLPVEEPKKKFGGGKGRIIATILGLFLLVGGVGTGAYLVLQNQNPNEKAGIAGSCADYDTSATCIGKCSPNGFKCKWLSATSKCSEGAISCSATTAPAPAEVACEGTPDANNFYVINGTGYAFCGGCVSKCVRTDLLASGGCERYVNNKCGTGGIGGCLSVNNPVNIYYCEGGVSSTAACSDHDPLPAGVSWDNVNKRIIGKYCGTIQVDMIGGTSANFCRGDSTSGCATPKPPVTQPSPTPICSTMYYCNKTNYTCVATASKYDPSTHVQCGGGATCEQNLVQYASHLILPNAQCYSSLATCSNICKAPTPSPTPKPTPTPTKSPSPTPKPTPTKTPSPTPTPLVTAQCQNVTAYSPTWTVLTATQLSQKKAGDVVNFCVVGSASAGIFDKAKFTINNTAQAETTSKRPNTQDYCQSYTIPANTYSYTITAQIHHATLGWK